MVWLFGLVYGLIIQINYMGFNKSWLENRGMVEKMKPIQFLAGPNIMEDNESIREAVDFLAELCTLLNTILVLGELSGPSWPMAATDTELKELKIEHFHLLMFL